MSLIVKELEHFKQLKEQGRKIPVPNYFYVERYGRSEYEALPEIAKILDCNSYFFFQTGKKYHEKNLLRNFQQEMERYAETGSDFEGLIMIECSNQIPYEEELPELLTYLQDLEDNVKIVFTMKKNEDTEKMEKLLRDYFFLKTIQGESYSVEEQIELITDVAKEYGMILTVESIAKAKEILEIVSWQEERDVKQALGFAIKALIYDKTLCGDERSVIVENEMVKALENLDHKNPMKGRIGFYLD